ncbi:hypothetical protein AB0B21_33090 [Streptomyces rimosus]|uniref:hypothetical protein n=1 Tax=Streptomyces rimosus TaxID=1927 RepID=UPI000B0BD9E1|nr:hypothetical protein [Streptomyces rimosus]
MKRRLVALLLALVAIVGLSVSAPQPAAAADGPIGNSVEIACRIGTGPILGTLLKGTGKLTGIGGLTGSPLCDKVGDAAEKAIKEAWKAVWDSLLGDIIKTAEDVTKWVIKKVLTVALMGPSVDLEGTGLWGKDPTLAGMLTWLGLVIAVVGIMWQLGKMALTGQIKHVGRAMAGWGENVLLSTLGVGMFALLLVVVDALTSGLVNATFASDGDAYERIVAVMLPAAISNPITVLCIVAVLLLVGFIQMVMVFLRQSGIPLVCLLLPVAGGGRTGGDATRQWAPKLITAGLVILAYKPTLAIIICTGFAEFGHSKTLAEWLRGCATLVLGVLAPGPLTKIFAPFGAAVGGGLAAGGASGALSAAASYMGGKAGRDGGSDDGGTGTSPSSAVEHARYVEQSMGSQSDGRKGAGGDAQAQAARTEAGAKGRIGAQGDAGAEAVGGEALAGATGATGAAGTAGATGAAGAAPAAAGPGGAGVAVGIQVLDGVNDAIQNASGQIGGGNQQ